MRTAELLTAIVGADVHSQAVQDLILADELIEGTEPDYEEGQPQRSWLANISAGYQIMHCEGRVTTVFLYVQPTEGFSPFLLPLPGGLPSSSTRREVLERFGLPERSGEARTVPGLGRQGAWDRFRLGPACLHFQYTEPGEQIHRVTIMDARIAP